MERNLDVFENMPVGRAVATLTIPTVMSMLVTILYNMADTFFVGQTGDANQVAAVSLAMPVFLIFMAMGNIFGIGGSSYISRSLGNGEREKVKQISSFCLYGSLALGLLMIVIFIGFMPSILQIIGVSTYTRDFANDYLLCIAYGAPFVIASSAFSNIVRGEGAAKEAMIGMMIGTVLNIVLDPIMILWMDMGVVGAALATVIGNIASCIYFSGYLLKGKTLLSASPKDFCVGNGIMKNVLAIGIPASINSVLMSAANVILNNFLVKYGDSAVAAMGVAMRANMLVVMLQMGVAMGTQPLIGYCYGAGKSKRMKDTIGLSMLITTLLGVSLTVIYWFLASDIIKLFIADEQVMAYGEMMLRALMISGPFLGILFVVMNTLQAMGKAMLSLVLSICRQGIIFLPIIIIFNQFFGLNGLIYAQPIADLLSLGISLVFFMLVLSKEINPLNAKTLAIN